MGMPTWKKRFRKGAVAAVANSQSSSEVLAVPDSLAALQNIATWARNRWDGQVVGVTGSAGKTTSKDMIAAMLAVNAPVAKTIGNLNNHVGLPLSILRMPSNARVAVLEMAMNHSGEIRRLSEIARPDIGVVTNVGHAHMEAFDSIEGVAGAKRELIESLPPDGVAVLNFDDPLVIQFRHAHPGRTVTFGLNAGRRCSRREHRGDPGRPDIFRGRRPIFEPAPRPPQHLEFFSWESP